MGITKLVLKRPVTTFLVVLSLVFFGVMSLFQTKMELTPDINMPMLVVYTIYPGAAPDDVSELITKPIEEETAILSSVKTISSSSAENMSIVMIQYDYGTDMDKAYDDLKKKIDGLNNTFPEDAQEPTIMELNMNEQASMYLTINNAAQDNLYNYAADSIVPELEKLSSVASVETIGGEKEYVKIELIPERLQQYHLDMTTVAQLIGASSFTYPAGTTAVGSQELSFTTAVDYPTVESLKQIPLMTGSGNTIYLKDIAEVGMSVEEREEIGRYNGEDTLMITVSKNQKYSAVDLSKEVMQAFSTMEAEDPNLEVVVIQDQADQITGALSSVFQTMILAVIISMIIIYVFFGDIKASLIVGTSIPISILTALIMMWGMGYSMNMITLSSLVLGVGMMVDNSIVVLEACFRAMDHIRGKGKEEYRTAALAGSETVGASVLGSTLTTCVVFLPLGFMAGLSGQFFQPLGFTIVFCMVASLISAVSIVPLCFVLYRPTENMQAPAYGAVRNMQNAYRSIMQKVLPRRKLVMVLTVLMLLLSFVMASDIRMEMMPGIDEGTVTVTIETRPGLKIEEIDRIVREVETVVAGDPDTENYMASSGGSGLSSFMGSGTTVTAYLKGDREKTTDETVRLWRSQLEGMTDCVITVDSTSMMSSMEVETDYYSVNLASADYAALKEASDEIVAELQGRDDVTAVHSSLENSAPLIKAKVDTVAAAAEGLSPMQIAAQLNMMLSGTEAMTMTVDGQEDVSVMVEYPETEYDQLEKVEKIMLQSPSGSSVMLRDVADIVYEDSPASISRENRKYTAVISADYTQNSSSETAQQLDKEVIAPHLNGTVDKAENAALEMMNEEFGALGTAILIAVFLIFVVMAAQFESPKFSFMVMTTIPFSLIGSFFLLWIVDSSISMPSLLGFLMLIGTVVNNGILYVDTVNQYRMHMGMKEALVEAGAVRLRPILMTTLTTIVSMIPMALAIGDNGELMQGLALVDVGGLTASTILALLLLPVYYSILYKETK